MSDKEGQIIRGARERLEVGDDAPVLIAAVEQRSNLDIRFEHSGFDPVQLVFLADALLVRATSDLEGHPVARLHPLTAEKLGQIRAAREALGCGAVADLSGASRH